MTQRLVVIRDRLAIGCNAERSRDIQRRVALRQLPQATEQAFGRAPREDERIAVAHPQCIAREHGELVLLLPWRGHG